MEAHRPSGYFESERNDVAEMVPDGVRRVLDVGCGAGRLGRLLKLRGVEEVHGLELDPDVAAQARELLDSVLTGDVEASELPYPEDYFDCVIYSDVLEHLHDPLAVMRRHRVHIRPEGWLVASIPNVRFCGVVLPLLLRGEWRYQPAGVLDQTHLRFFTRRSALRLVESAGYRVLQSRCRVPTSRRYRYPNALTLGRLREWLAPQILIRAQRSIP